MQFPATRPDADAVLLWRLQNELLLLVEGLLGPRDGTKQIYQPVFQENGPNLRNTPNLDGAFAELSPNAGGYWPTAVFELAHETVHLLNPIVNYTNWLEEGVAVAFSLHALVRYGLAQQLPTLPTYAQALKLVQELPGGAFAAPGSARLAAGALNAVTSGHLQAAAPTHPPQKVALLVSQCVPR